MAEEVVNLIRPTLGFAPYVLIEFKTGPDGDDDLRADLSAGGGIASTEDMRSALQLALDNLPGAPMVDELFPDGEHRYWSTHCRHGHHGLCSAKRIVGAKEDGSGQAAIAREPAQCKTCAAPCVCPCHQVAP